MMRIDLGTATRRALMLLLCGLGASSSLRAATVADYYFNGPIGYSAATQMLTVDTGSQGARLTRLDGLASAFCGDTNEPARQQHCW